MKNHEQNSETPYKTFIISLLVSFIIMYGVMFLNVAKFDHVYNSFTRIYMTLLMVSPMALIKLGFMSKMYKNAKKNIAIITVSIFVFISSLFLLRAQEPIGDIQWMKAMIPHHSSAIMTSSSANIKDPEVKKLAEDIIKAQEKEIAQMKSMIARLKNK